MYSRFKSPIIANEFSQSASSKVVNNNPNPLLSRQDSGVAVNGNSSTSNSSSTSSSTPPTSQSSSANGSWKMSPFVSNQINNMQRRQEKHGRGNSSKQNNKKWDDDGTPADMCNLEARVGWS